MILRFYINPTTYENSNCPLYRYKTVSIDNDKYIAWYTETVAISSF